MFRVVGRQSITWVSNIMASNKITTPDYYLSVSTTFIVRLEIIKIEIKDGAKACICNVHVKKL